MTDWSTFVPGPYDIETHSGAYLNLKDPDPSVITLEDIAHGLAYTCRYNGQCAFYYSVAQHAVMVSRYLELKGYNVQEQLNGLHHDDAEAFYGDVTRPLKGLLQPVYGQLTATMDERIAVAFDNLWQPCKTPAVEEADTWALAVEAWRMLPSKGKHWNITYWPDAADTEQPGKDSLGLWTGRRHQDPEVAANAFIRRHNQLIKEVA